MGKLMGCLRCTAAVSKVFRQPSGSEMHPSSSINQRQCGRLPTVVFFYPNSSHWGAIKERQHCFYFSEGKETIYSSTLTPGGLLTCEPRREAFIWITAHFFSFFFLCFLSKQHYLKRENQAESCCRSCVQSGAAAGQHFDRQYFWIRFCVCP